MSDERPPVEGLSEIAWARIERGVFARLDDGTVTNANAANATGPMARRRGWLWLAVPALAGVAAAGVFLARPASQTPAAEPEPARVVTGASPTELSFDDAHVALDPDSALVMPRDTGSATLIEHGAAWFTVAPRGARPPFVVLAGDTTVRVIGTRFRVSRDGDRADVAVDHGIVEVSFRGAVVRVTANQTWTSDRPTEVATTQTAAAEPEPEPELEPAPVVAKPHHHPAKHSAPAAVDPDEARYTQLTSIEARQPETAMQGYLALAQGSSKWAQLALYAAARLAFDRHDPRAETFLIAYLHRFPSGANADDATRLLNRIKGEPK